MFSKLKPHRLINPSGLAALYFCLALLTGMAYAGTPGTLKWIYPGDVTGSPALGIDGCIYINSNAARLHAVNPDGTLKLLFPQGTIATIPVIGADGTVYTDNDGAVNAYTPQGILKWSIGNAYDFKSYGNANLDGNSIALGLDGSVYYGSLHLIGDMSGNISLFEYGFSARSPVSGWTFNTGYERNVISSGTVAGDGAIYFADYETFHAIDSDGIGKWGYSENMDKWGWPMPLSSITVGADDTVYASLVNEIFAFAPDGSLKWEKVVAETGITAPVMGVDGTLYLSSGYGDGINRKFHAVNPDGTVKWTIAEVYGSAAVGADGIIYVASYDGKIVALNPNGGIEWIYDTGSPIASSPVLADDGTLYVTSSNQLYAVYTSSLGLAKDSSWPMFRHDAQHTGRQQGYTISGVIKDVQGKPLAGVSVADSAGNSVVTDEFGKYKLFYRMSRSGVHTLKPSLDGLRFRPESLTVTVPPVINNAVNFKARSPRIPGDLNDDDKVNCDDIKIVRASFGKKSGQAGFDARADVNGDKVVDVRDLNFVSRQMPAGLKCP